MTVRQGLAAICIASVALAAKARAWCEISCASDSRTIPAAESCHTAPPTESGLAVAPDDSCLRHDASPALADQVRRLWAQPHLELITDVTVLAAPDAARSRDAGVIASDTSPPHSPRSIALRI